MQGKSSGNPTFCVLASLAGFSRQLVHPMKGCNFDAKFEAEYRGRRLSHMGVGPVEIEMGVTAPLAIKWAPITAGIPSGQRDPAMTFTLY